MSYPLDVDSLGTVIADSADAGTVVLKGIDVLQGGDGAAMSGRLVFDDLHIAQKIITAVTLTAGTVPDRFALGHNYPNPFNPATRIEYDVPVRGHVNLTVWNAIGQRVATLLEREVEAGRHAAVFDASSLPSGLYFARLQGGSVVVTRKMVVVK